MEILNTTVVTETVSWYGTTIMILGIAAGFLFAMGKDCIDSWGILAIIGAIMCVIVLVVIGCWEPQVETDRKRYEVTIDESVSLIEIYEKYDVIEQKGKIWILEDKDVR